jgi:putative MATE family efflux protein
METKENKMAVMPIHKLLFSMSLPMILAMLVQAFYNVVDSIFVSRLSENALTAVSLAFPVQNLMIAVATGTGVGVNAILSKSLGEKNAERADQTANNGVLLAILSAVVFAVLGATLSRVYFRAQTDIAEIVDGGTQYLRICLVFSFGLFVEIMMERLLQGTGRTIYTMVTQGIGAIINIIMDPILIFGYFGFPKMGVAGAAVATVAGQIVAMLLGILFNLKVNADIHLSVRKMKPNWKIIRGVYAIGFPSILMVSVGSLMNFFMNKILLGFVSTAAAVFGVYYKLQSFIFMPVFGLNNGMVPIVAYNYGARNRERILQTVKLGIACAMGMMLIGLVIFQVMPDTMLRLFNASDDMLAIGRPALRIISLSFVFAGFCIVSGTVFQALGRSVYSLIVSVARQLVVLLPVAYLFSLTGNLEMVWWSFPIAELASLTCSALFLRHIFKTLDI